MPDHRHALAAAAAAVLLAAAPAGAEQIHLVRFGSVARLPLGSSISGLPPTSPVSFTIAMKPQDAAGLAALATAISTPGSPDYRRYLSEPEFAGRFGALPAAISAVESTLRASGLDVGAATANRLTLPVSGTAAEVENALATPLEQVEFNGRLAYANTAAPALPSTISGDVQGIVGLDTVTPDEPAGLSLGDPRQTHPTARREPRLATGGPQPCPAATGQQGNGDLLDGGGLTDDEVASAYGFSSLYAQGDFGAGQTVALYEEQPYASTDIASYQACYSTDARITNIDVDGGPGAYEPPPGGSDDESALDIDQIIGLAPRVNLDVYAGPAGATVDIIAAIVSQDQAKVISSSYGLCEALTSSSTITAEATLLQEAATQGQSFFISSGDSGSTMCYQATEGQSGVSPNDALSVIDPAGQTFATGVGGTTLYSVNASHSNVSYTGSQAPAQGVWNDGYRTNPQNANDQTANATGGGLSQEFAMPSYQSTATSSVGVVNANSSPTTSPCGVALCRQVPDVSADADPQTGYVVFIDGQWTYEGGTSASAPLWAAFTALTDASTACRGQTVGFINPDLYEIAGTSYATNFTDITGSSPITGQASNDPFYAEPARDETGGLYPVRTGYDMATGLGSMIAPNLAASLCGLRSPIYAVGVTSPGSQRSLVGAPVSVQLNGTDAGATLTYSADGLPAGLSLAPSTGLITGKPTTAGRGTVTVTASDAYTNSASTAFTWTVVKRGVPRASAVSLRGVARGAAKLRVTVKAGANAPALGSVRIVLPTGLAFAHTIRSLARGVLVTVAGKKVACRMARRGGELIMTPHLMESTLSITIARPAITVSGSLRRKARHHAAGKLRFGFGVVDVAGTSTRFSVSLKA